MSPNRTPLCVIGGGNMAQAIVRGGLDAGVVDAACLVVVEPDAGKRSLWAGWGVRAVPGPLEAMHGLSPEGQVLLAVKPQVFGEIARELAGLFAHAPGRVVMSIMAGVTSARVHERLGPHARVVRLMPNTPAGIRKGITAIARGAGPDDDAFARALFAAVGDVVEIDESLMDAFTAVAGSGPAYVFYLAEGLARGAVEAGFAPDVADRVVRAVLGGAAGLLECSTDSPETLRAAVTSKGGTTAAGVGVLDARRVMDALVDAVVAARDRGRELGE